MRFASRTTVFAAVAICAACSAGFAQDVMDAKLVDGAQQTDMSFGPTALARPYTTREAAKWGFDFIASPSRAADRRLFFAYKIKHLPPDTIAKLLNDQNVSGGSKPGLVAFVNVPKSGPLPVLGGDKAYYGTPYLNSPSTGAGLRMREQFSQSADELAPRVVAVSALKSAGIAVSGLNDEALRPTEVEPYIAVTSPLPGMAEPDMYFIMGQSSWGKTSAEEPRNWGFKLDK